MKAVYEGQASMFGFFFYLCLWAIKRTDFGAGLSIDALNNPA
jgi:hypothetical protein